MYAGFVMALVLLSASVERVGVSRMRDFCSLDPFIVCWSPFQSHITSELVAAFIVKAK